MSKILVTRSSMPSLDEYMEEIKDIWDSHWLTNMGVKHKQLENKLKEYLDVENISLMTNGHLSLELGIQAMNLKGEVITTPFTFASTTHAIVRNGLTPVFCDINPDDYTIDVDKRVAFDQKGKEIKLTTLEFDLLLLFVQNKNKCFSREEILDSVWGKDYFGTDRVVDDLVRRLRKKMPLLNVSAVYGYGYRLS